MPGRRKISTTVSEDTYSYLEQLIHSGKAANLAEALDLSMDGLREHEMQARLEQDTAAYFESLPQDAAAEESRLESALEKTLDEIDLDAH
jgi:hypothetical protein